METLIIDQESFSLSQGDFIIRLLVAIGIGGVIGLERQYHAMNEESKGFAGIRTFVFLTLLGFVAALFSFLISPWVYVAFVLGVSMLIGVSYWFTSTRGDHGATTEFSSLLAFVLGSMALIGLIEISLMITVLILLVLSSKFRIKTIVGKITAEEMYDFIRFVVIALLIFPFLPDQTFGPYDVLNPREIGWVIILTSGLGLAGYALTKFLGTNKGILLGGIVGGLVSSTAVTWIYAKKSKENESLAASCATAILGASSIMFVRLLIWTSIFSEELFIKLLPAVIAIFASAIAVTLYIYFKRRSRKSEQAEIPLKKALDLKGALIFGLIYVVILLLVSYANENLGTSGTIISSAIAGFSDIDAITISISKLAGTSLDLRIASLAVLVASISNTLVKMGIGIYAGSPGLRKNLLIGYGTVFLVALAILAFFI
ncbi:MgtC/SapB family protein [Algoriphagus aestuariicola]|uniref:MgtC/SapB family protein n=1 Tax=Algoriphagus aestuariicola TaxID=1852016 RepID=A0ABS3BRY7_9BACT|nr:MgtC/SapB family protein [Algoriphagus aestuariicola]MBN7801646.1 MgtC/SapB family protein [Algoriphagus aestuariicola]